MLYLGEVAFVAGGFLPGNIFIDPVEIFSPNGKCNYMLAPLPKKGFGHAIFLYNGSITVCDGYLNQVVNFISPI